MKGETTLGFLAGYYACAERQYRLPGVVGQVAKSATTVPPKDPGRYKIGEDILYVFNGIAADVKEAESHKRKCRGKFYRVYCGLMLS